LGGNNGRGTGVSDIYIVDRLFKVIRERRETITEAITEGSVQDYAAFRHLRGRLEAWNEVEEEFRLLLKRQDKLDDE
jgi:hypothetical protein